MHSERLLKKRQRDDKQGARRQGSLWLIEKEGPEAGRQRQARN